MAIFRFEDFSMVQSPIGIGGFAKVYKATYLGVPKQCRSGKWLDTKECVAIKEIYKASKAWRIYASYVKSEINIHKNSCHTNIVELYDVVEDKEKIWFILELCDKTLLDKMRNRPSVKIPYDEKEAYEIIKQVVDAVIYLHNKDIVHRDLSAKNILLKGNSVKLADFGLSSVKHGSKLHSVVGTHQYMAPDVKKLKGYDEKVDCWNIGVVLYELLFNKRPKLNISETFENEFYENMKTLSDEARELLNDLLAVEAKDRLKITDVPKSNFFLKHQGNSKRMNTNKSADSGHGSIEFRAFSKERGSHFSDSGFNSKHSAQNRSKNNSRSRGKFAERRNLEKRINSGECSSSENRKPYILSSSNNPYQQHNCIGPSCGPERQLEVWACTYNNGGYYPVSQSLTSSNRDRVEKSSGHNFEEIPPLNAAGLKPKRSEIKGNIVIHVTADRQVIVEVLKRKKKEKYVSEVFIISTDGMKIEMYIPPKHTLLDKDRPAPLPVNPNEKKTYIYPNLPHGMKQYAMARKFVDILRAKTPKLIYNGPNAKFFIMENYPNPVCQMDFYDGSSIKKKGETLYIIDKKGKRKVLEDDLYSNLIIKEFKQERENCEEILKFFESRKQQIYPIVIGLPRADSDTGK